MPRATPSIAGLLVGALAAHAAPASACSLLPGRIGATAPVSGATVPANPVVVIRHEGAFDVVVDGTFQIDGSTTSVPLEAVIAGYNRPLAVLPLPTAPPGARATVILREDQIGRRTELSIEYGSTADHTAPAAPPSPRYELEHLEIPDSPCGGISGSIDEVYALVPAGLDSDVVAYEVTTVIDGLPMDVPVAAYEYGTLVSDGLPRLFAGSFSSDQDVCLTARALDQAGNWSARSPETCLSVSPGCTSVRDGLPPIGGLALGLGLSVLLRGRRRRAEGV